MKNLNTPPKKDDKSERTGYQRRVIQPARLTAEKIAEDFRQDIEESENSDDVAHGELKHVTKREY